MDRSKIITIKDIAEKAGVSIGTVDRVVHDRGRVSEETANRVRRIIREMGYKPNMFASRLSRAKVFHFGVLIPNRDQDSGYWAASLVGIEKAVSELAHYGVVVHYFFFDRYGPDQYMEKIGNKIAATPLDGLLIAPVLHQPVVNLVHGMPKHLAYVFINTMIPELHPISFIGQDSYQSGVVCGRLMQMLVPGKGSIAIILVVPDDLHIRRRATGFRSIFKNDHRFIIREYLTDHFDSHEHCEGLIDKVFAENPDLLGIFVTNVCVHYFAEYIQRNVKYRKIGLIGYDLIDRNIDYLKVNLIDFLISQKPDRQGYEGIYALYRTVVLKEKMPKTITMPIDIITKENVVYYEKS